MIISASRRTAIPALYPEWFMFVFWTKNPKPMLPYLKMIDRLDYRYYLQMTITDYDSDIAPHLSSADATIAALRPALPARRAGGMIARKNYILLAEVFKKTSELKEGQNDT